MAITVISGRAIGESMKLVPPGRINAIVTKVGTHNGTTIDTAADLYTFDLPPYSNLKEKPA